MNPTEVNRFNELYHRHLRSLKLQGKSQKTVEIEQLIGATRKLHVMLIYLMSRKKTV